MINTTDTIRSAQRDGFTAGTAPASTNSDHIVSCRDGKERIKERIALSLCVHYLAHYLAHCRHDVPADELARLDAALPLDETEPTAASGE